MSGAGDRDGGSGDGGSDGAGGAGGNGKSGPPQTPMPIDPQMAWEIAAQEILNKLSGLTMLFIPNYPREDLPKVVAFILQEQIMYSQKVMPVILSNKRALEYPKMVIQIRRMASKTQQVGKEFMFPCPKRPSDRDPETTLRWAILMLFVMTPEYRALLRIYGYDYQLIEAKDSPIIQLR